MCPPGSWSRGHWDFLVCLNEGVLTYRTLALSVIPLQDLHLRPNSPGPDSHRLREAIEHQLSSQRKCGGNQMQEASAGRIWVLHHPADLNPNTLLGDSGQEKAPGSPVRGHS